MKKILLGVCAFSLLTATAAMPVLADEATDIANRQHDTRVTRDTYGNTAYKIESKDDATPIDKEHAANNADYSEDAGDGAANVDMGLTAISVGTTLLARFGLNINEYINTYILSLLGTSSTAFIVPVWNESMWFNFSALTNPVGLLVEAGHAAVNRFMRDTTQITASFAGVDGHVTDQWVGPPDTNHVVEMADLGLGIDEPNHFKSVTLDPALDYGEIAEETNGASARELMEYRAQTLLEDQRSLENVADKNWQNSYLAQQRAIRGLAMAFEMKKVLLDLKQADEVLTGSYNVKLSALNTLAARRMLHDELMALKMNVLAIRTKMRAETMELNFKPFKDMPETEEGILGAAVGGKGGN